MEAMMHRMRMAATGFAVLVVLGVLFFVGDEEVAEEAVSTKLAREAPVVRTPEREPAPRLEHPVMDNSGEFTPDDDLIDHTEGLSTEGFDTRGIDTGGFETGGFDTRGLEPEPELDADPALGTAFEYAIVVDDGGGS